MKSLNEPNKESQTDGMEQGRYKKALPWIKLWTKDWLLGSLSFMNSLEEQGFFVGLLALANECRQRGHIRANPTTPFPHSILASRLNISLEIFERLLTKMIEQGRAEENENGIFLPKFFYYQVLRGKEAKQLAETAVTKKAAELRRLSTLAQKYPRDAKTLIPPVVVSQETGVILGTGSVPKELDDKLATQAKATRERLAAGLPPLDEGYRLCDKKCGFNQEGKCPRLIWTINCQYSKEEFDALPREGETENEG